ncbi:MAG: acetyl-CoA carboxylase carboxyltransferase subunit alpha [Candidatus Firestonebacteria bacterium]|nr:acetyl-CoA carboxylase carboxyltransferase subunit alpha [Candidatus Firestonebacteria bacterium]
MATETYLEFEKAIVELDNKIAELRLLSGERLDIKSEIATLEQKAENLRRDIYKNLSPWQIVQVSRHPQRPHTLDYIQGAFDKFVELHGDRAFIDDRALVGGLAWLEGRPVVVLGTQKGKDTKENLKHNFGLPLPEGYRKALRLMRLAEKFNLPVVTLVDTAGAFPGLEGEERGVAEAIAHNLRDMSTLRVPIVVVIIGEGGSGGALGIGVGDRVAMLQNSSYSVITPEGCAAILWKDRSQAPKAAEILRLTAPDLKRLGVIEDVIAEPLGGAHRDQGAMIQSVKSYLLGVLPDLQAQPTEALLQKRYQKFRSIGVFDTLPKAGN